MSQAKVLLLVATTLLSTACVSRMQVDDGFANVTVRELATFPDKWNGRRITVSGWLVGDFENFNLYGNRNSACRHDDDVEVVGASFADILSYGKMRHGTFRGTFHDRNGQVQPSGEIIVDTGSAGPGPLEIDEVVSWSSNTETACR